jgi:hypothetical protein
MHYPISEERNTSSPMLKTCRLWQNAAKVTEEKTRRIETPERE